MAEELPRTVILTDLATQRATFARTFAVDRAHVELLSRGDVGAISSTPEVVWLAECLGVRATVDLMQGLRRRWPDVWILASFGDSTITSIPLLLAAGVDDVVRATAPLEECRARLCAARRWQARGAAMPGAAPVLDLAHTAMWEGLPHLFESELADFTGVPVFAETDGARPMDISVELPVSLSRDGLEVLVRVSLSVQAATLLCQSMLGLPAVELDVAIDLAKEAANTIAGAFKRRAADDDIEATIGMPRLVIEQTVTSIAATGVLYRLGDDDRFLVGVDLLLKSRPNMKVPAATLREGMVVVSDVRGAGGALLVAGGTRLTETSAQRLASHLGPKAIVTVVGTA